MPRNRHQVDPEHKRAAIVAVARRLFVTEGYEATGMARIAGEAGVAPNTLYWYFDDKDALLVAMLDELVGEALEEYASIRSKALEAQLAWLLAKFEGARGLIATVHARVAASASVRQWHERFHGMLEATMVERLAAHGVQEAEQKVAARVATFVVEGLLSHPMDEGPDRDTVIRFVAQRVSSVTRSGQRRRSPAK